MLPTVTIQYHTGVLRYSRTLLLITLQLRLKLGRTCVLLCVGLQSIWIFCPMSWILSPKFVNSSFQKTPLQDWKKSPCSRCEERQTVLLPWCMSINKSIRAHGWNVGQSVWCVATVSVKLYLHQKKEDIFIFCILPFGPCLLWRPRLL